MLVVNTDFISGKKLETLEIVRGSVVMSKHIGRDIMAGFRSIVGGEITGYTEMLNEARIIATSRMVIQAEELDADAVVNVRYETASVIQGAAEIIVYGTAVKYGANLS